MFGYLAKQYKTNLLDPTSGKPPNLMKTIQKMQETIYTFFKESSEHVWAGCGMSLIEIIENCFPDPRDPGPAGIVQAFIEPLIKFHTGGYNTI